MYKSRVQDQNTILHICINSKKKKISILHKQLVFSIYYSLYNETIFKAHFELEVVTPEKRLKPLKL